MSLPITPNEATRHRVRLAQASYRLAVRLLTTRPGAIERLAAIVQIDFANELVLKTFLIQSASQTPINQISFANLIDAVEKELKALGGTGLPAKSNFVAIHTVRNAAQHEGRMPTDEEVHVRRHDGHVGLRAFCQQVFDIDFDLVDVDAVRGVEARHYLELARAAREAGEFTDAMGWLAAALRHAVAQGIRVVVGTRVSTLRARPTNDVDRLLRAMGPVQETVGLLALGLDAIDYASLRETLRGAPPVTVDGSLARGYEGTYTAEDVEVLLQTVPTLIVQVEEATSALPDRLSARRSGP